MRVLPRVTMPTPKAARRLWRQSKQHLSVRRVYYTAEILFFAGIYLLIFSGRRLRYIDAFGSRSDLIVTLLLVAAFILFHWLLRQWLLPRIELYYEPTPYDERKIFFDLGQDTQHITTIDQLYQHLAEGIRNTLEASNAAIFVRDETKGDFKLRVLATQGRTPDIDPAGSRLRLSTRAFVVRRRRSTAGAR